MQNQPLVSVIIPCFNQGRYLRDAIKSVTGQTYKNWECIIVNDGSTDNTKDVSLRYSNITSRIKYIEQNNRGLSGARNRGLQEATGEYIQFLDADDLIHAEKLKLQIEALTDISEPALSFTDYFSCDINDTTREIKNRYLPPKLLLKNPLYDMALRWETELSIPAHCFLFQAAFFKRYQIEFDETLPNHEDWDCWMRIFAMQPIVIYIDQKLAYYRIHDDSMCYDRSKMRYGFLKVLKKQKKLLRNNRKLIEVLNVKIRSVKYIYRDVSSTRKLLNHMPLSIRDTVKQIIPRRIQGRIQRYLNSL